MCLDEYGDGNNLASYQPALVVGKEYYFYSPAHKIWYPKKYLDMYGMPIKCSWHEVNQEVQKLKAEINGRGTYFTINFMSGTYRAYIHVKLSKTLWTSLPIGDNTSTIKRAREFINETVKELLGIC